MLKKLLVLCFVALTVTACSKAPAKEQVQETIKKFIPMDFEVLQISEKDYAGLYEVVVSVKKQPVVFYVDKKCQYIFSGSIMSAQTKANLTEDTLKKFQNK
ncbi:disulfide isomerase DsbC N-terminal domain-containing protein [Geomonas agri]|uniref:disulfide isomerase DsbC N-terminal domain-containing protein n=1 Tax=Geomonas agri TaxID=2873702 RepID=UPI001CD3C81B|nr:disulfide isomerase DsbC N-terminal domain-containing protein [Geomonas agri]